MENNIFGEKKDATSPRNEKIQQNLNYHQYLQSKKFEELINHKNFLSNPLTVNSSQVRLSSDNLDSATNNYYLNIDNFKYPSNKQHRVNYFSKYDKFGNKNLIIFEGANRNYKSCDKNVFSKKDIITKVNLNDFNPNKIHLNKKSVDPYFSIKKI